MSTSQRDGIGDRMKRQYEDRTRYCLPRRTFTIVRVDGKAFHTYTRHAEKPYDFCLMAAMDEAAKALCAEMQGCVCAYGQSDEYSFLLTDFASETTEAWFDGNIQKMVSVAASTFAVEFCQSRAAIEDMRPVAFDARAFTIPDRIEVENYFIWRQQDAIRNAILMAGYAQFSPKEMHGMDTKKVCAALQAERGIDFEDYPVHARRGRVVFKEACESEDGAARSCWSVDRDMPILTQQRGYFTAVMQIPEYAR